MKANSEVIIMGAMGRMGQMILQASQKISELSVIGAVEKQGSPSIGRQTGIPGIEVSVVDSLEQVVCAGAIIIDFTAPEATLANLETAHKAGAGVVVGTTGFSKEQKLAIQSMAKDIPILLSPNMSLGVNVCFKINELIAKTLKNNFDVEIIEAHHRFKKDAPSGTALGLAEAVARGLEVDLEKTANYGRQGVLDERPRGEIGIHAIRGGDIAGDHTVLYAGEGERIEVKHVAHDRSPFAKGALVAAQFLSGKKSGFFTMLDVLEL